MLLNLNNNVKIKLTKHGIAHFKNKIFLLGLDPEKHYESEIKSRTDENGYTEMQLWAVMNNFGDALYNGCKEMPFETTIEIVENKESN